MRTILNTNFVDNMRQPIFLGESLSLQRYDKQKYRAFYDIWQSMLNLYWKPEEFELKKDACDFKTLDKNMVHIFTSTLSFQTVMDSGIQRIASGLSTYVSNLELECCCTTWAFFEQIHSYSYTYIIKNVFSNPCAFFDSILKNKEIVNRSASVVKGYEDLINCNKGDIKDYLYRNLIAINILEGVQFYTSFACSYIFSENKLMTGNSEIIKLINRDENKHVQLSQQIIKILSTVEEEGFIDVVKRNKDIAIELFANAAKEEKSWAAYLFKDGSVLGLNEKILCQYIEYLVNLRMKAIGLPKLFSETKNPIESWLRSYTNSSISQTAAQEQELSNYLLGAIKTDTEDLDLSGFEL